MADPRGPLRAVVSVEVKPNGNFVRLACGHTAHLNPIYAPPRKGDQERCVRCCAPQPAGSR